jgi:hypothetical protein
MSFLELDTVVLRRDLPEFGLCKGDMGAVVQILGSDAVEVEFVRASGRTQTLVSVPIAALRRVDDNDLLSVRSLLPPA